MNVCYEGPLLDYSGYGEANRHAVAALEAAGIHVVGKLLAYSQERSDYGTMGPIVDQALNYKGNYRIKIMHTTPDEFKRLMEPGKYHIAHFFWETDKVPDVFAQGLQLVDEIWTGSQANKDAIEKSGVTTPVKIYPQATEVNRTWPEPYELPNFNGYLFYSIFEWTDRKNPKTLIRAFYEEFSHGENVGLLIKTYFRNFTFNNKKMIRSQIEMIKASLETEKTAPLFLYLDLMDRQQVMRVHSTGDCYVSAHRGEGWGVPQVEAALAGKPSISTGYGGVHEWLTDGEDAILLPYKMKPLRGMEHSRFYDNTQNWAEVDFDKLKQSLRYAFAHQEEMAAKGAMAKMFVTDRFNFERVGKEMADRLKEIEAAL